RRRPGGGTPVSAGFSPEWLALREPADRTARSADVLAACAAAFRDRPALRIVDIGAGTGATLRSVHGLLPPAQDWTLVDHDPNGLATARELLSRDPEARDEDGDIVLDLAGRSLRVRFRRHDLGRGLPEDLQDADLVTASALFDLASPDWIEGLAAVLARNVLPLLSMLTFDGTIRCRPGHRLDVPMAAAFAAHQKRDKGLGIAAGPAAARGLTRAFAAHGYRCVEGESPWHLASGNALRAEAVDGIAAAVAETALLDPPDIAEWRDFARNGAETLTIGHADLFALPPG
ncbi:MAG: trans-aconitate 2-methyltransferase, partial [Alphaproteobacteria bacterium]